MVVATTFNDPYKANKVYGKRFGIEPMHKDWKTNAFCLETHISHPFYVIFFFFSPTAHSP
jgi:hypothetical protein